MLQRFDNGTAVERTPLLSTNAQAEQDPRWSKISRQSGPDALLTYRPLPTGITAIASIIAIWANAFLQIILSLLSGWVVLIPVGIGVGFGYLLREFGNDVVQVAIDGWFFFSSAVNWVLENWINYVWREFLRPFVPLWNILWWAVITIVEVIFDSISIDDLAAIFRVIGDLAGQIVPILVILVQALVPVLVEILPSIITIITQLIVNLLPTFVQLIQVLAQLVLYLIPLLQTLLPILADFITDVIQNFGPLFIDLIEIGVQIIEQALPFINELLIILQAVVMEIQANVTPGMDFFEFLGVAFASILPFVAQIFTVFVNMIVAIVQNNLPLITALFITVVQELTKLVPPVVTLIIQIVTQSFPVLIELAAVLFNAVISLIPVFRDVFNQLLASNIIGDLIDAIIDVFLVPRSPAVIENIFTALTDFIQNNISLLETAMTTLVNVTVIGISLAAQLLINIAQSGILEDLLTTVIDLFVKLFPIFTNVLVTVINTVAGSDIIEDLLEAIINTTVSLLPELITFFTNVLPFSLLVDLLVQIIVALTSLLPVVITLLSELANTTDGITALGALVNVVVVVLEFLFTDPTIKSLIPDVLIAIINGLLQVFTGSGGSVIDASVIQFLFNIFDTLQTPFFILIAQFVTGNSSIDPSNLLTFVGPVIQWVTILFDAVGSVTSLFAQVDFLTFAFEGLEAIVQAIEPIVSVIEDIAAFLTGQV